MLFNIAGILLTPCVFTGLINLYIIFCLVFNEWGSPLKKLKRCYCCSAMLCCVIASLARNSDSTQWSWLPRLLLLLGSMVTLRCGELSSRLTARLCVTNPVGVLLESRGWELRADNLYPESIGPSRSAAASDVDPAGRFCLKTALPPLVSYGWHCHELDQAREAEQATFQYIKCHSTHD